jgi:hypothetical protein
VTLCEQLPEGCDLTNCHATFKVLLYRFLCNLIDVCYHRCHKQICNHDQKMERLDNYIWSLHEIIRSVCLLVTALMMDLSLQGQCC